MALRAHHQALLRSAVEYANRGWPVFVLGRSKRPVANCPACRDTDPTGHDPADCPCLTCHGFYAATLDPDRIAAMVTKLRGGLLAVRTGSASGLVIVDIDPRNGGGVDPGLMNPTMTVATGGGGWHLYYQHPGTPVSSRKMPGREGVDIKGDGGYAALPPSIHPKTCRPYQWVGQRPLNEMAPALRAVINSTPIVRSAAQPLGPVRIQPREAGAISNPQALLAANLAAVDHAPQGRRRRTLYGAARGVARMVATGAISPESAWDALYEAGRRAEQTDRDIHHAVTGGFQAEGVTL